MQKHNIDVLIKKQKKLLSAMDKDIRLLKRQIKFNELFAFNYIVPSIFRVDALRNLVIANLAIDELIERYNTENLRLKILTRKGGEVTPLFANIPINKDK